MELRQLRYLIALAQEGSFTRAAAFSNVAQPALSRQVQKLERELGLPLVDRTTRRVTLTAAGHETVAAAKRALLELETLSRSLQQTITLLKGTVRIGVTQTPGPMDIPRSLAHFSRCHPGVDLFVREGLSVELATQLREDRIDLAVISGVRARERRQLELQRTHAEVLMALLPADHRLAQRRHIGIADLDRDQFISFPPGATIRQDVDRAASEAGYLPHTSIETNDVGRTVALVAEGLGVAVLPETHARGGGPRTAAVALRSPTLRYEIYVATRASRQLSPPAEALRVALLSDDDQRRETSR